MGGSKLIHTPTGAPASPGAARDANTPERYELYSIADDPGEVRELGTRAPQFAELRKRLTQFETRFLQRLWARGRELQRERQLGDPG